MYNYCLDTDFDNNTAIYEALEELNLYDFQNNYLEDNRLNVMTNNKVKTENNYLEDIKKIDASIFSSLRDIDIIPNYLCFYDHGNKYQIYMARSNLDLHEIVIDYTVLKLDFQLAFKDQLRILLDKSDQFNYKWNEIYYMIKTFCNNKKNMKNYNISENELLENINSYVME
jgi:hypothetical protein